jgi:hypothetical protein
MQAFIHDFGVSNEVSNKEPQLVRVHLGELAKETWIKIRAHAHVTAVILPLHSRYTLAIWEIQVHANHWSHRDDGEVFFHL